jgi:DNA repair photolyase
VSIPNNPKRGRGAPSNPNNRFQRMRYEDDPDAQPAWDDADLDAPSPATRFEKDASRSVLSRNDSPDVPFEWSLNPYRGCEHGCVYCYARPTHEYLGFSAGLDFETRIVVKENAPDLLRAELSKPSWEPQVLAISGVTDAYQPIERKLELTRRCLQVCAEFRNPVQIITKSDLVLRDIDVLKELAAHGAAAVAISVTTLDRDLARILEPRACQPQRRLAAIAGLARAGIPVGVLVAPVLPGLTDHEIPSIVEAAAAAGAQRAGYVLLRLPHGVGELFEQWLDVHMPNKKEKVLGRIRAMRGGKLNDPRFGSRMRGDGPYAEQIRSLFELARRRAGLSGTSPTLSAAAFRDPQARR